MVSAGVLRPPPAVPLWLNELSMYSLMRWGSRLVVERILLELRDVLPSHVWCRPVQGHYPPPPNCNDVAYMNALQCGLSACDAVPGRAYNTPCDYCGGSNPSEPPRADNTPGDYVSGSNPSHVLSNAIYMHLLKRIKGYVRSKILLALDGLKIICPTKLWVELTNNQRKAYYNINEALRPWIYYWIGMDPNPKSRKLHAAWKGSYTKDTINDGDHVVYARLNIHDYRMYIGKTSHYNNRFKQHTAKLLRRTLNKDGRHREHRKYSLQLGLYYTHWITIPLATAHTSNEALKLERWWITRLNPSINAGAYPIWQYRNNNTRNYRYNNDTTCINKAHPRFRHRLMNQHTRSTTYVPITLTKYKQGDTTYLDVQPLIRKIVRANKPATIHVIPGSNDLTNWRHVKKCYGLSYIRINNEPATTFREWNPATTEPAANFTIYFDSRDYKQHPKRQDGMYCGRIYAPGDYIQLQDKLAGITDSMLHDIWKERNNLDKFVRKGCRAQIWEECVKRFPNFQRAPLTINIPSGAQVNRSILKTQFKELCNRFSGWPDYLIEWHVRNLNICTKPMQSIGDIMINVNKPWRPGDTCNCQATMKKLRDNNSVWCPPCTDGHILFTGREYRGPHNQTLLHAAGNIPKASKWDINKTWKDFGRELPFDIPSIEISRLAGAFPIKLDNWGTPFVTTKDVYKTRKILSDMVIGPIDKNQGELTVACPHLYHIMLRKLYCEDTGYKEYFPRKCTRTMIQRYGDAKIHEYILQQDTPPSQSKGQLNDVISAWRRTFKNRGWDRLDRFNSKGNFNIPYALFKEKNIRDKQIREDKWAKGRPIAPGTKHPMKKLLSKAGRAWYFMATQVPGEILDMPLVKDMPSFLEQAKADMEFLGHDYDIKSYDIEGCFPNMPKEAIELAALELTHHFLEQGEKGVWVPCHRTNRPAWSHPETKERGTWMPLQELYDILVFALHNAFIKMPDGRILKQLRGIPMGDPLSPAMTILTCAWMEREWLKSISTYDKIHFKGCRFMDDILLFVSKANGWNAQRFLNDFKKSECYWHPLKLEEATADKYLETTIIKQGHSLQYRLKNDNETERKVWKYHDYRSRLEYNTKRAIINTTLQKVHKMASNNTQLIISGIAKCNEFLELQYPPGILRYMCTRLAYVTSNSAWFRIRQTLPPSKDLQDHQA